MRAVCAVMWWSWWRAGAVLSVRALCSALSYTALHCTALLSARWHCTAWHTAKPTPHCYAQLLLLLLVFRSYCASQPGFPAIELECMRREGLLTVLLTVLATVLLTVLF